MKAIWYQKFSAKLGQSIFENACKDFLSAGTLDRSRPDGIIAALSWLIVISPYLIATIGIALVVLTFPNLLAIFFGGIAVAFAFIMRPRKEDKPNNILRRDDLPKTFRLLDEISVNLNAPKVTGVVLFEEQNAYATVVGDEALIGLGACFWLSLDNQERLSVLGHEIGHFVNDDPARHSHTAKAHLVLEGWIDLAEPAILIDHDKRVTYMTSNSFASILLWPIKAIGFGLLFVFEKLLFIQSQNAEYLADATGAKIAGKAASMGALKKLAFQIEPTQEFKGLTSSTQLKGAELFKCYLAPLLNATDKDWAEAIKKIEEQKSSVDSTHPPTKYRLAFLEAIPDDVPVLASNMISEMDEELEEHWDRLGNKVKKSLEVQ